MAPFSICSICQKTTRKVVRDPVTLKNIYVCPICYKSQRNQKQVQKKDNKPSGRAQRKKIAVQEKVQMTLQDVPNESLEVQKENGEPKENDPRTDPAAVQTQEETPEETPQEVVVQVEVQEPVETVQEIEEMPPNDTENVNNIRPKITPPMMEVVVINNRKYIAVSATADYDSPIVPPGLD